MALRGPLGQPLVLPPDEEPEEEEEDEEDEDDPEEEHGTLSTCPTWIWSQLEMPLEEQRADAVVPYLQFIEENDFREENKDIWRQCCP